ncbi:T9SS type A sorting domain-containing protein [Ferruginibacter albus]|uniref:T9SS type A sorting domain-containing protein n=1 Tax=Ferruginibacter albus TaxID=2875540 RepID=UPI001CC7D046|nr:T9SS type A sorting domain-containing protein [Ferruginibacter albus]UAY52895.1 T9SS type A sorting domain-containing protein [Ferruginibacter albus]
MKKLIASMLTALYVVTSFASPSPLVTTTTPSSITNVTATLGGSVNVNTTYVEKGIVWSTTNNTPTTSNNKIVMGSGNGTTWSMTNAGVFPPGTLVYVRAYCILGMTTIYSSTAKTFTTLALSGTGAVYDFEAASGTYTGFGTRNLIATNTTSGSSMQITSVDDSVYRSSVDGFSDGGGRIGSEGLYFGMNSKESAVTFAIQGNNKFDLNGFYLDSENGDATDYVISSSKGSITVSFPTTNTEQKTTFIDIANNANAAYLKGISSFTITPTGGAFMEVDHLVLQNIVSNIILPLKMISFTGNVTNHAAVLDWSTNNEINTKEMQIERSTDGNTFTSIGTITAVGNGNNNYHFTDATLNDATGYYRIKTIDVDGKATLSNIVKLTDNAGTTGSLQLLPNLLSGSSNTIKLKTSLAEGRITIYNQSGAAIKNQSWKTGQTINVETLNSGSYFIQLTDGKQVLSSRFIKE